jgi:hypothetical protein
VRLPLTLVILAAGIAISVAAYLLSGGRLMLLFLPLILGLPLLGRRRD